MRHSYPGALNELRLFVSSVRLINLLHVRRAAVNPDAVTAANDFAGLKSPRLNAGPTQAEHAVVARQPLRREPEMIRRDQNGRPAELFASGEACREISPGLICHLLDRRIAFGWALGLPVRFGLSGALGITKPRSGGIQFHADLEFGFHTSCTSSSRNFASSTSTPRPWPLGTESSPSLIDFPMNPRFEFQTANPPIGY